MREHRPATLSEDSLKAGQMTTKVYFRAAYAEVQYGEFVCVVGGLPELGDWNPERAVKLVTSADIFPCWISEEPIVVDLLSKVEYKYVVLGSDGRLRAWETYTGNREFVASGAEMTLEDDEGLYRRKTNELEDDTEDPERVGRLKSKLPMTCTMSMEERLALVRELEPTAAIDGKVTVFMVSLKLPMKVEKCEDGRFQIMQQAPNDGRNFAFLPLMLELRARTKAARVVCVGWPGIHPENMKEQREIEKLLRQHDCIPVFPPREEFEKYLSFCIHFLWPTFHDAMLFFQTTNPRPFDEAGWAAYKHMNNVYAKAVVPHTHESDLIWIHDFHLLMAPTFISRKFRFANIGLFLHTPFPSSDGFKCLPMGEELLSGMLCADQLGFQFFPHARNFLVSVKRLFGLDSTCLNGGFLGVDYHGRMVMLKVAHFSYPYKQTTDLISTSDELTTKAAEVRTLFEGKKIFASMDRCDGLSGLLPKFQAFKRFISERPQYRGKVVLVQYIFESSHLSDVEHVAHEKQALISELQKAADAFLTKDECGVLKIEKKKEAGEDACLSIFLRMESRKEGPLDRIDRLALFKTADVMLDACVKAGLNLMPFEFITSHFADPHQDSVLIVSEFSGCCQVLLGSIRINPWNTTEVINACEKALTMDETEKKDRAETNLLYCSGISPMEWFEEFMADLRRARKKEGLRIESIGFGTRVRDVYTSQNFQKLSIDEVLKGYHISKNRVFLLDNEGTLSADTRKHQRQYGAPTGDVADLKSRGTAPNEQVLDCLQTLCKDSRNTVVILSGRDREMLEDWFGKVEKIGLAAERGFYNKLPTLTGDQWHCMEKNPDFTWKSCAYEIMRQFVKRTQGSYIENKGSALVWQYRDVDQHFGSWQAKELSSHLKELLFGFDVDIEEGKGYVEVKLLGINKGVTSTRVLEKVSLALGDVDFVLCLGDDQSDEDMFQAINQYVDPSEELDDSTHDPDSASDSVSDPFLGQRLGSMNDSFKASKGNKLGGSVSGDLSNLAGLQYKERNEFSLGSPMYSGFIDSQSYQRQRRFFVCTVGRKPSAARFYLDDTDEVSELLLALKSEAEKKKSFKSGSRGFDGGYSKTWSGGDPSQRGLRGAGSMPTLSSLAFAPS